MFYPADEFHLETSTHEDARDDCESSIYNILSTEPNSSPEN